MRFSKFQVRLLVLMLGGAAAVWLFGLGSGTAAAQTNCTVANNHETTQVRGPSGCGAKAGVNSQASASDSSGGGTAIAVADNGGNATARNLQPGSSALAGANTGGTAYSVTTGPGALSVAQARRNGTTVAVGGWGGQAYAGPDGGAKCAGGFAAGYDSNTGKGCVRSGSIDLHN